MRRRNTWRRGDYTTLKWYACKLQAVFSVKWRLQQCHKLSTQCGAPSCTNYHKCMSGFLWTRLHRKHDTNVACGLGTRQAPFDVGNKCYKAKCNVRVGFIMQVLCCFISDNCAFCQVKCLSSLNRKGTSILCVIMFVLTKLTGVKNFCYFKVLSVTLDWLHWMIFSLAPLLSLCIT